MNQLRTPRAPLARRALAGAAIAAIAAVAACSTPPGDPPPPSTESVQPAAQSAAAPAAAAPASAAAAAAAPRGATVTVYKTPTCGCCVKWVEYMREHGYNVVTHDADDLSPVKAQLGVPENMGSCHTATVNGYVLEGHVPATDVDRLLRERPAATGIAVPGMPTGSPGMEVPGVAADRYDVVAFSRGGATRVFASH